MYSVRTVSVPQMLGNSHVRDRKKQEDDTFKGGCRYHREGHKNRAEPGKRGDPYRREAERDHPEAVVNVPVCGNRGNGAADR